MVAIGSDVPQDSQPQPRRSNFAQPAWKAGLMEENTKQSNMLSLNLMLITISDAVRSFDPCLPIYKSILYVHFTRQMTVAS